MKQAVDDKGLDWLAVLEQEPDAGLGNGGLGRLAACFLDSMATMQLPAMGYGLRYEYGIFRQTIQDGWQHEQPDNWLRRPDPWEVARPQEKVEVKLGCSFELRGGSCGVVAGRPSSLIGIPFDRPVVGYGGRTINTLRLWAAAAPDSSTSRRSAAATSSSALAETLSAESLTRVLYPDDSTSMGQGLRFVQEYFLVACSLADLVRRFRRRNSDWSALPDKVAIQLNDTHPAMAVPELMRILLDEAQLGWDQAWDLTRRTLAYTNHTLLPEALEKWPLAVVRGAAAASPGDHPGDQPPPPRGGADPLSGRRGPRRAHEPRRGRRRAQGPHGQPRHRRLAQHQRRRRHPLRAAAHDDRQGPGRDVPRALQQQDQRRDAAALAAAGQPAPGPHASPRPSATAGSPTSPSWRSSSRSPTTRASATPFRKAKREAKSRFADWLKATSGVTVDPDSIFDCQVKRIHEYKRQLLNALRVVVLYNRLRQNPDLEMAPRTFFFAGKAAPAYHLAKLIIKFINNLAGTIDGDPAVRGRLKVVFLPEYCVSLAERLIPATDVSNQISTAGYEASGTSNMKFMMNGALTIGTRDGATIEMAEAAGEENFFLFGLTAEQVADSRGWYSPQWHYDNEPETRAALDLIFSDHFSRYEPGVFEPMREHAADGRRPLHAPGGPDILPGGGPAACRVVRRSGGVGA